MGLIFQTANSTRVPSYFKCPSAYCVPVYAICNGRFDCPNGEDEEQCQVISCPGFLLCRDDSVCVHPQDVWSGRIKCPVSIDDKALYHTFACPNECECLGNGMKCSVALKLKLPTLPSSMRLLIIRNAKFPLNDLAWRGRLIALLHLECTFCHISVVKHEHVKALPFLKHLILRNNLILTLQTGVFMPLSDVEEIDLGFNLISKLNPGIFKGANKLQILRLDANRLSSIAPCTFHKLLQLRVLNLSDNHLTHVGDNVFCQQLQSSLRELYIGGDYIKGIDKTMLSHMQNLTHLNITPLQICCFLPKLERCYPTERFYFSTCTDLLGIGYRYAVLLAGTFVLFICTCSIIWICREMKGLGDKAGLTNKNLNNILNLIMFTCHCFKGLHMIILPIADAVFHGYYALYEEIWRRYPLCILLNMLSYTCLLGSTFVYLLIAYMRMIAIVYPFKLSSVSVSRPIGAIAFFLCISLIISYLPFSGITSLRISERHVGLGLAVLLPFVRHRHEFTWVLSTYVFPMASVLCVSSALQTICICVLIKNSRTRKQNLQAPAQGRGPVGRCVAALLLHLCCQMPLVCLHITNMSGIDFPPHFAVAATVLTLLISPIADGTLFVVITPDFLSYVLPKR